MRKTVLLLLGLVAIGALSGCSNYHELSEYDMVAGIAVDFDDDVGEYRLTLEILDMDNSTEGNAIQSKLIVTRGETVLDAIISARTMMQKQLHFGNMEIIILNHYLLQETDISEVLSWFLHEVQVRETTQLFVSLEGTASEIFYADKADSNVISFSLRDIILRDKKIRNPRNNLTLYSAINQFNREGIHPVMPAVRLIQGAEGEKRVKLDGMGAFHDKKLVGFLTHDQVLFFQFACGSDTTGSLTAPLPNNRGNVGLQFDKNKTDFSFDYADGQMTFYLQLDAGGIVNETPPDFDLLTWDNLRLIESTTEEVVRSNVLSTLEYLQIKLQTDIVGFGEFVSKHDPKLWQEIRDDWDQIFQTLKFEVDVHVQLLDSGKITNT